MCVQSDSHLEEGNCVELPFFFSNACMPVGGWSRVHP